MPDLIHINNLNAQGLRDRAKRFRLYEWLKSDVTYVQETHFTEDSIEKIIFEHDNYDLISVHSVG